MPGNTVQVMSSEKSRITNAAIVRLPALSVAVLTRPFQYGPHVTPPSNDSSTRHRHRAKSGRPLASPTNEVQKRVAVDAGSAPPVVGRTSSTSKDNCPESVFL